MAARTRCASSTVYLLPELATALNPQQARVGEIVILEPLVFFREISVARATLCNAVTPWLPSSGTIQGQENYVDADAEPVQTDPHPSLLPQGEGGNGGYATPQ
jgi:hypothetical protein